MGSFLTVMSTPRFDLRPGVVQAREPVLVQALGPQPSIERLDQPVIRGLDANEVAMQKMDEDKGRLFGASFARRGSSRLSRRHCDSDSPSSPGSVSSQIALPVGVACRAAVPWPALRPERWPIPGRGVHWGDKQFLPGRCSRQGHQQPFGGGSREPSVLSSQPHPLRDGAGFVLGLSGESDVRRVRPRRLNRPHGHATFKRQ